MSKQDDYVFSPIMGEEDKVLSAQSNIGNLYFTTDTGKIYLDTEDKQKLAIGGNVNLFYGQKDPPEFVDDEETEFDVSTEVFSSLLSVFGMEQRTEKAFLSAEDEAIIPFNCSITGFRGW